MNAPATSNRADVIPWLKSEMAAGRKYANAELTDRIGVAPSQASRFRAEAYENESMLSYFDRRVEAAEGPVLDLSFCRDIARSEAEKRLQPTVTTHKQAGKRGARPANSRLFNPLWGKGE